MGHQCGRRYAEKARSAAVKACVNELFCPDLKIHRARIPRQRATIDGGLAPSSQGNQ